MNSSTLKQDVLPTDCYYRRITYGARVFGLMLRLAGVVLLVVQIVQSLISFMRGTEVGWNTVFACVLSVLMVLASRRRVIEPAVAKFAAGTQSNRFNVFLFVIPFFLSALILWVKVQIGPITDAWKQVSSEGSLSEYGTALAYLMVPIFAYPIAKLFRRQGRRLMSSLYYLLLAGAFFIGMEEISWGQRLIGFEEPEFWARHNVQSEFTFHNLSFYQYNFLHNSFLLAGFVGSVSWVVLRLWRVWRRSFVSKRSVQLQLKREQQKVDLNYLLPDWSVSSFFYPTFIFYYVLDHTDYGRSGIFLHQVDQEHWEFVMSLGVLLFVVISFFRQAREDDAMNRLDA